LLQLALATLWLLDGVLQLQPVFFTKAFGSEMIAGMASGNPWAAARAISASGSFIAAHATAANTVFASIQLLLGFGIAWRPTIRVALGTSIVWSLAVWWIGEGFGGLLSGGASLVAGAPGAALVYALLAVVLWPVDRSADEPCFVAAGAIRAGVAKAVWVLLWGSLAYFCLAGPNRSPGGLSRNLRAMAAGEPAWLAGVNRHAASLVIHHGLPVAATLAVLLAFVAVGVYLPARAARAAVVTAVVVSLVLWAVGQDFGTILAGGATDPNSGPLLAALALVYWPSRASSDALWQASWPPRMAATACGEEA